MPHCRTRMMKLMVEVVSKACVSTRHLRTRLRRCGQTKSRATGSTLAFQDEREQMRCGHFVAVVGNNENNEEKKSTTKTSVPELSKGQHLRCCAILCIQQ